MKNNLRYILFFAVGLFLIGCKKYPENTLWFRTATNTIMTTWKLDQYTVDGTDSTNFDDVQMYREKGILFQDESLHYGEQCEGIWKLTGSKKNIALESHYSGPPINFPDQKILFRGGLQIWTIEKLSPKQFWISLTSNGIKYQIRFKN